jgi:hypothetical protein
MVSAVVLRDAVVVMVVVPGDRRGHGSAGEDAEDGEKRRDSRFSCSQHGLTPFVGLAHVRKLEMACSIATRCRLQWPGGAAPTMTALALAPATRQAISR